MSAQESEEPLGVTVDPRQVARHRERLRRSRAAVARHVAENVATRLLEIEKMAADGATEKTVASRFLVTPEDVQVWMAKHGARELYARLVVNGRDPQRKYPGPPPGTPRRRGP